MKKTLTLIVGLLLLAAIPACGQSRNSSDYNYRKACDALFEDEDSEKALKLINEQLEETPKHADSYCLRARIRMDEEKFDAALRDLTLALQYHNSKTDVYKSTLYLWRGAIYSIMEKNEEAVQEYLQAVKYAKKDNPSKVQDYKFRLGQAYYDLGDISKADGVFLDMLKDDAGDGAAMVGLSRNCLKLEKYEDGLKWLEKAESYDASYSQIYRFKMSILDKLGRTDESVDAAVKYFELDDDAPLGTVAEYVGKHYSYGVARVKAMINKNPTEYPWLFLLAQLYEDHCDYRKAIEQYDTAEKQFGDHDRLHFWRAMCYSELGQFDKAISSISKAIEMSGDNTYVGERGDMYRSAGRYAEAIADYKRMSEEDPTVGYYYYAIGWSHELQGDKETALDYYNQGIDVDKTYPYLFVSRGDLLKELGRMEEAKADYEKVLEIDTEAEDGSCRQYALVGLDRADEAVEWVDKIISKKPEDHGGYYDKACVCGRVGRIEEGMKALETSMEKGFRKFSHLQNDDDMDPYRELPQYKALVEKYTELYNQELTSELPETEEPKEFSQTEVQMKKMQGGTYEVPCSINGLPLKFIFDTGASDVTISSLEAGFMLKNNYLDEKDFKGKRNYVTATGEITEGAVICLKEVRVGDVTLKNINASVVKNQKAPLLLGQSVLERFGSIKVDNEQSKLIIEHR